jgi:UDP-glucuronate decarboxylase
VAHDAHARVKEDAMLTALVTGGAGFLGGHLCGRLLESGRRVICVDSFYTGTRENVAPFARSPGFTLVRHDVTRPLHLQADEIYNLACPASPMHYQRDPLHTLQTSVLGAMRVLELAHRNRAKVLQASTSEVYGDPEQHPQQEEYWGRVNPVGIRACYDEGKRCAETLFFDYQRRYGLRTKVVRIFNTYGPKMQLDDGRVVSNFIVQALQGEALTVYGDGTQTRSLCYVDDMVEGLMRMMDSGDEVTGPVNLGNPEEYTVLQLAELVREFTGSGVPIIHHPLPGDDPRQRRPDISQAKRLLGWQPRVDVATGLRRTIADFRARLAGELAAALPAQAQS